MRAGYIVDTLGPPGIRETGNFGELNVKKKILHLPFT
jgi:hypothetical protein